MRAASAVVSAVAVLATLCLGMWLGGHPGDLPPFLRDAFVDDTTTLSGEAAEAIEDNYFRDVERTKLNDASIAGMVEELRRRYRDRFSHYFDPRARARFEEATQGRFSGVGMTVREMPRGLLVVHVFKGAPAARAGIGPGDLIVSVDGKSIAGEKSRATTAQIKGPPGTRVTLGVLRRPPNGATKQVKLVREEVRVPVVDRRLRSFDGLKIGYVRLAGFTEGSHLALRQAVMHIRRRGAEGILLDLRENGGGLLREAILTSSIFLPDDDVVVKTVSRQQGTVVYRALGDNLPSSPMVVLIDRGTASAAEILASALADNGLATTVGSRSFGKGVFQQVFDLSNGGALDLTIGRYFTADGVSLAPKGIQPDVRVEGRPATEQDEILQRALSVLSGEIRGN